MTKLLKLSPSSNFYIQEFISPWWMEQANSPAHVLQGLQLTNPAMIEGTQLIRDHVGESVTINNWHRGGGYEESGLRTPRGLGSQSFALFSTHMFWKACDLKFKSMDTADVAFLILSKSKRFNMIVAIEDPEATRSRKGKLGKDWLHIVFGYRDPNKSIKVFKP